MASKVAIESYVTRKLDIPPKDVMGITFDKLHDTNLQGSCGGYVSSSDASLTKWYSRVNHHQGLQELSEHL